jgi:hypothetical protein
MGEIVEGPQIKKFVQSYKRGLDDNIKTDLEDVGCGAVWWIEVAQERHQWRDSVNRIAHKVALILGSLTEAV